ncbi:PsbP-related protein [Arcticibacter tournemirensis]
MKKQLLLPLLLLGQIALGQTNELIKVAGTKCSLIPPSGFVTASVNGIYPEESKTIEGKIKDALLSTVYDSAQNDDPLSAATFSIDVTNTDFKLIKYISGSLIYSTDGKIPTDKPTLIVGHSIAKVAVDNQKEYAEKRLKKLPGGERLILKIIKEITIDNLKGYEIIAGGKTKEDKTEIIYQVMLFDGKGDYYLIVGTTREDTAQNIKTFKSIARIFKRK